MHVIIIARLLVIAHIYGKWSLMIKSFEELLLWSLARTPVCLQLSGDRVHPTTLYIMPHARALFANWNASSLNQLGSHQRVNGRAQEDACHHGGGGGGIRRRLLPPALLLFHGVGGASAAGRRKDCLPSSPSIPARSHNHRRPPATTADDHDNGGEASTCCSSGADPSPFTPPSEATATVCRLLIAPVSTTKYAC